MVKQKILKTWAFAISSCLNYGEKTKAESIRQVQSSKSGELPWGLEARTLYWKSLFFIWVLMLVLQGTLSESSDSSSPPICQEEPIILSRKLDIGRVLHWFTYLLFSLKSFFPYTKDFQWKVYGCLQMNLLLGVSSLEKCTHHFLNIFLNIPSYSGKP